MRLKWLKLFLLVISAAFALHGYAQECTGSLGDPVINQDFGHGENPGPELGSAYTTMFYTTDNCPNDKYYTIAHNLVGSANCHHGSWHDVPADHTGNTNGYMMIINASQIPSVFFTQKAGGLCPNTKYKFSAFVLNLLLPAAALPGFSEPNIQFSIETTDGHQLITPSVTGTIDPTDDVSWKECSTYFTTPANVTDVVVKMTNLAPGGNGNDLILDDITFRACGPNIQAGFASFDGKATQDVCLDQSQSITLAAKADGNPLYQWQFNTGGDNWADISGANANTYTRVSDNSVPGTYLFRVGVVVNGGDLTSLNCRTYSAPLAVVVNSLPVASVAPPPPVCEDTPLTLTATGGDTYIWTGPNVAPTQQNPLIIPNAALADAGQYTVTPYFITANSQISCAGTPASVQVSVVPKLVVKVNDVTPVCAGESAQLNASGGLYYKWTPSAGLDHDDIANPVARPLVTTTYNVTVSTAYCSDNSQSVTVNVLQNPTADGGGNKSIFEGQSIKLNGTAGGDEISTISWTPAIGLDNPASATPIASPTDDIVYTMTVTSLHCGISLPSTVAIKVYKKIVIPNTFSPNNDGINDLWDIEALFTFPESITRVFNRYGKMVFQSTGYSKPWDGTYNGSPLPEGAYYYVIDLKNNTPALSGWVLVVK